LGTIFERLRPKLLKAHPRHGKTLFRSRKDS
jgi:hypothetical protein